MNCQVPQFLPRSLQTGVILVIVYQLENVLYQVPGDAQPMVVSVGPGPKKAVLIQMEGQGDAVFFQST